MGTRSVGLLVLVGLGCGAGSASLGDGATGIDAAAAWDEAGGDGLVGAAYEGGRDGIAIGSGGVAGNGNTGGSGGAGGAAGGAPSGGPCAGKALLSTCGTAQPAFWCEATWAAAQIRGGLAGPIDYGVGFYRRAACGAFHAIEVGGADTGVIYYFDAVTDELAAVFDVGLDGQMSCDGGASTFTPPVCGSFVEVPKATIDGGSADLTGQ